MSLTMDENNKSFTSNKYKLIKSLEDSLNNGDLEKAKEILEEYEFKFGKDEKSYSSRGILNIYNNELEDALENFNMGLKIDENNFDLLYNIGYVNSILGNYKDSIRYYKKSIKLSNDKEIISEVNNNIYNSYIRDNEYSEYTFILVDIDNSDDLFQQIKKNINNNTKIISIRLTSNEEKMYIDENENIIFYELSLERVEQQLDSILNDKSNFALISSNYEILYNIDSYYNKCRVVYYPKCNLYTENNDYINYNLNLYREKQICDKCDLILTNNINVYNFKKINERRQNVYIFKDINDETLDPQYIIWNYKIIDKYYIGKLLNEYSKKIDNEYIKLMYDIAINNIDGINLTEFIYEIYLKYNTKETYLLYLNLLNEKKDYENALKLIMNNEYCTKIFKSELKYLFDIKEYDLIKFIINLSTSNYKKVETTTPSNLDYKIAHYNYEVNSFDIAYEKYLKVIDVNSRLINSPLIKRNISYLMYWRNDNKYKKYYEKVVE